MNSKQNKIIAFILLAFLIGTLFGTAQSWVFLAASNNVKGWNPFVPAPTIVSPKATQKRPVVSIEPTLIPTPTDIPTDTPIPYVPPRYIPPTATPVYNYDNSTTNNSGF